MESFDHKTLTGAQLRAARALIGVSAEELARRTQLGLRTIRRAEGSDGIIGMTSANAARIVGVLRDAGVQFIPENGGGVGVRLASAAK